jgi:hypothetical protein
MPVSPLEFWRHVAISKSSSGNRRHRLQQALISAKSLCERSKNPAPDASFENEPERDRRCSFHLDRCALDREDMLVLSAFEQQVRKVLAYSSKELTELSGSLIIEEMKPTMHAAKRRHATSRDCQLLGCFWSGLPRLQCQEGRDPLQTV